jgi:hypothetical protein
MTKEDFITFIKELGFTQSWSEKPNLFSLLTDQNDNNVFLNISINDGLVHLSESKMWSNMNSGKSFGYFSLNTFGNKNDFQLEIFLSFILGSFNKKPSHIVQFMRDMKIKDILQ